MEQRFDQWLLGRFGPCFKLLHAPAFSAQRRAFYLGETGARVVKSVLVQTEQSPVIALVAAHRRVDLERLATLVGARTGRLAQAAEVAQRFADCDQGIVPAFGRRYGIPTALDEELLAEPYLFLPGTTLHADYRLPPTVFRDLEQPHCGRFSVPAPRPPRRGQVVHLHLP